MAKQSNRRKSQSRSPPPTPTSAVTPRTNIFGKFGRSRSQSTERPRSAPSLSEDLNRCDTPRTALPPPVDHVFEPRPVRNTPALSIPALTEQAERIATSIATVSGISRRPLPINPATAGVARRILPIRGTEQILYGGEAELIPRPVSPPPVLLDTQLVQLGTFAMKESDPSPAAGNIAYESMRLLERLSKLSPVPGLDVILGVVNNIAKDLKLVHKNQQEYIRLSRRCVEVMCIVHQEALQSGVEGLDEHIERFIGVFGTVYIFLRSRGHRHRGKFGQWLYRDDISQQLDECRQMLDNALKDWMLVLSLRTFTRVNRPRRGQTQMFPEDFAFEQPQGAANRDLDAPPSLSDALLDPGVSMTVDTAPIIPLNAATSASPLPPPPPAHRVVNEETAQNAFKELGIDVVDSSDRNKMDRDRPKPTVDTNERPLGDAWRLNILGVEYTDRHAVVLVAFVAVGLLVVGRTRY